MSFQSPWLLLAAAPRRRRAALAPRRASPDAIRGAVHEPRGPRERRLRTVVAAARPAGALRARAREPAPRTCSAGGGANVPGGAGDGDPRHGHVPVDAGRGRPTDEARGGAGGGAHVLDQVPDRLRVGLVVFAGEAQVATPPTRDHDLVRTAVDEIDSFLVFGGTAIGDALETAVELGKQVEDSEPPEGERSRSARPTARRGRSPRPTRAKKRNRGRSRSCSCPTAPRPAGSCSRSRGPSSRRRPGTPSTPSPWARQRASSTVARSALAAAIRRSPSRLTPRRSGRSPR